MLSSPALGITARPLLGDVSSVAVEHDDASADADLPGDLHQSLGLAGGAVKRPALGPIAWFTVWHTFLQ